MCRPSGEIRALARVPRFGPALVWLRQYRFCIGLSLLLFLGG